MEKRFKEIFTKYYRHYGSNATVICPSLKYIKIPEISIVAPTTSKVNDLVVRLIKECAPEIKFITDAILKMTTDEIWEFSVASPNSHYYNYLENKGYSDHEINELTNLLEKYLDLMDSENSGVFKRHMIPNKDIRNAISKSLQFNPKAVMYEKDINGRDLLIIDDTLTYGQTVSECVNIITDNYRPKSITVLTMFSTRQS